MKLLVLMATAIATAKAAVNETFYLELRSNNTTYNGTAVTTSHQGAGISSLSVSTSTDITSEPLFGLDTDEGGGLYIEQVLPDNTTTWFPIHFEYDPYTNYASCYAQAPPDPPVAVNTYSYPKRYQITQEGLLVMKAPIMNDTLAPDFQIAPASDTVNRWYVCDTWAPSAYRTTALVWGLGIATAQNPTCVKVDVVVVAADD